MQDTFLPLLMAKLKMYGLYDNFAEMAHGFCDFTSFMTAMHMGQICRATKFGDMVDVYKQVTGRPWPKDVTHRYSTCMFVSGSVFGMQTRIQEHGN